MDSIQFSVALVAIRLLGDDLTDYDKQVAIVVRHSIQFHLTMEYMSTTGALAIQMAGHARHRKRASAQIDSFSVIRTEQWLAGVHFLLRRYRKVWMDGK
ncbi:hypothetical protein CEXT_740721 [Caerostris extrusa]|uniref:Uncharacterized protein n=1 Tax=Caerostris extrusa TaxID=172846 RepID=A0AAV4V6L3_CAEEX|nr:hypothetical protein CEXT_740721 [Caerostris extrusa]